MLLNKTDKARAALSDGLQSGLSPGERRILILTDGKRTLNDVMALLGPTILPTIDSLLKAGFISDASLAVNLPRSPSLGGAMSGLIRAATEAVQANTNQVRAAVPAAGPQVLATQPPPAAVPSLSSGATTPAPPSGPRRSLAASKMYILDMLQLQRNVEAIELRTEIQCTVGGEALVDALLRGLRLVQQFSTASYAQRVEDRLAEVLPEEALPRLHAMRGELPTLRIVG